MILLDLQCHKLLTDYELNELIKPTVDWLLKKHKFLSGNFASSEHNGKDRLVQWCHGAPGFVHMLLEAYRVCIFLNVVFIQKFNL